jgi:G patch domain-containing protein 1
MDEEDLADAAEEQRVQLAAGFTGLGSTEEDSVRREGFIDLFRAEGETMGVKLLKRMGWREGQGIGPKVRRAARLGDLDRPGGQTDGELHLFAPKNSRMISFIKKKDYKGLGYEGETRIESTDFLAKRSGADDSEDEHQGFGGIVPTKTKKIKQPKHSGIGIGVLNDTGSDDEDPYEIGPRISYNRVIGGDKKKKKPSSNGLARPVFISKKVAASKAAIGLRKCHDGRLPLDGFVLSQNPSPLAGLTGTDEQYAPPQIPEGWRSSKQPLSTAAHSQKSIAELAKAVSLDPSARAKLLGEAQLPGKSVFDYLSTAARERLVSASGKKDLPPALGQVPHGYALTGDQRRKELLSQVPKLDGEVATAALERGVGGWMPYADDPAKQARYRAYLESQSGMKDLIPNSTPGLGKDQWLKELQEFAHCARIFKPTTGLLASRFTSSSSSLAGQSPSTNANGSESLLSKPTPKVEDPAETAAKMGMYGPMTRTSADFYPSRLLCKRFNVKPPAHVMVDPTRSGDDMDEGNSIRAVVPGEATKNLDLVSKSVIDDLIIASGGRNHHWDATGIGNDDARVPSPQAVIVDTEKNDALEGERPGDAVFKAIFGDSDDDDE